MEGLKHEAEHLLGRTFGEFVLREPLSSGGFGHVFLAEQTALRREAVVKVLHERHQRDPTIVQRFLREARLATLLDHPYAAHTYAFGAEPDGVLWIAMELVRGTPLDKYLQAVGAIELERFVPLLERICEVVETAHEQGIVHRDLKPANVMVLARAGQLLPKLLDFGIAKVGTDDLLPRVRATTPAPVLGDATPTPAPALAPSLRDDGDDSLGPLTQAGTSMGSPTYMAPEQWVNAGAADARADTYALGVMCYVTLTGRAPFRAPSRAKLGELHARAAVPSLGPGFPPTLDAVLARAMAKKPADRFQTPLELAAAFRAASGVAAETVALPKLAEQLRAEVITAAPQPLAQAVVALEAARNAHQARDALWQLTRVAARMVGSIALACHGHVVLDASRTDPALGSALRRLRDRSPSDAVWMSVARELVRPFAALRDAHPVPELVSFLLGDASRPLDQLLALRAEAEETGGRGEEQVRAILGGGLALAEAMLRALDFLEQYKLVVPGPGEREAELWMGARSGPRSRQGVTGRPLAIGKPALTDPTGVAVVSLWPFVQASEPAPGAERALFFFDGRGRRGARMLALPDSFELEDDEMWESLGGLLRDPDSEEAAPVDERCPFPGLAAFTEADTGSFFGRERETEAAVNRLRVQTLLAVVGPSGAGKSSFVQAGVLPALPDGWSAITVRPGPAPLGSLAARLRAGGVPLEGDLREALAEDPDALGELLRSSAPPGGVRVLVIDQLEELFTLCDDEDERELFAIAVANAARSPADPVRVIVTVRDDFLVRAESLQAWRSRLSQSLQILTTPAEPELRRILVEPLFRAGYRLDDPDLIEEIVEQVARAPGALALLSFMVSRLWELRDRRFREISRKAYRSLGGVAGALAQHAEETLEAMPPPEQRLVREVFRHAVTAEGTRAVMSPVEMHEVLGGGPHATSVIEKLVAARLFVVSDAADAGGEQIEIAHETLLEAWPRLVTWRREDAEGARLRDQLRTAARQWDERGKPEGLLWRGDALAELRLWRTRHPGALTTTEEAFAAASIAEAAATRRRRRLLVGTAFVVLAGVAIALLILNARADRQRTLAQASEREAEQSATHLEEQLRTQYEGQGHRMLLANDPLLALAYLAKAAQHGAAGPAHDFAVAQAVRSTDGEIFVLRHDEIVGRVRFSPDGRRIVTSGYDNRARLWDAASGRMLADLPHEGQVFRVAFGPDGRFATGGYGGAIKIFSADGVLLHELRAGGEVQCVEFAPDGSTLLTSTENDEAQLWDSATGTSAVVLRPAAKINDYVIGAPCAFSPDGTSVAVGDYRGEVWLWDVRTRRRRAVLSGHTERVSSVRYSPDGGRLVTASLDDTVQVWRLATRERELVLRHRDEVNSAVFSPDGRRIATASVDQTAIVWDAISGRALRSLTGHNGAVNLALYSPDGNQLVTVDDATAQLWDAESGGRLAQRFGHRGTVRDVAFSPDGRRMVTASKDGTAIVWTTEPALRTLPLRGHQGLVITATFSPDGRQVATAGWDDGTARLWDVLTGRELFALHGAAKTMTGAGFSPDGKELATGDNDGTVIRWQTHTGASVATIGKRGTPPVIAIAWHPSGGRIAAAGEDGIIKIWSLDGELGLQIDTLRGRQITGIAYTPSGGDLAVTAQSTTLLFDGTRGTVRWRFDGKNERWGVRLDRSGTRGLSPTTERSAEIWSVADGSRITELVHTGDVVSAEWSPDDTFIVTASLDSTARVWEAGTAEQLAVFRQSQPLYAGAMSPSGDHFVAAGANGFALLWDLPRYRSSPAEFSRLLRCRVPFDFSGESPAPRPRDLDACR